MVRQNCFDSCLTCSRQRVRCSPVGPVFLQVAPTDTSEPNGLRQYGLIHYVAVPLMNPERWLKSNSCQEYDHWPHGGPVSGGDSNMETNMIRVLVRTAD